MSRSVKVSDASPVQRETSPGEGRPYELTPDNVADAALQLLRMAVEFEQRYRQDPDLVPYDREVHRKVQSLSGMDKVLHRIVNLVLGYRDHRRGIVKQVRAAEIARKISSFVKEKQAEQKARRQEGGLPRRPISSSSEVRAEIAAFVKEAFIYAQMQVGEDKIAAIVEAVVNQLQRGSDRFERIARAMADTRITTAGERTLQGISGALRGEVQSQGVFKTPEDARLALDDDPLSTPFMLAYVLRHADKGLPEPFAGQFKSLSEAERGEELRRWLRQEIEKLSLEEGSDAAQKAQPENGASSGQGDG